MKSDINRLLQERGYDALLIVGGEGYNANFDYMVNGAVPHGYYVQSASGEKLLVVGGMEFEEAQKSGLPVKTTSGVGYTEIAASNEGQFDRIDVLMWAKCLESIGVTEGKVALYGSGDINVYIARYLIAREILPQYELIAETGTTIFDTAKLTKDQQEIKRLRSVAERTNRVMQSTWDFISEHGLDEGGVVVDADGNALTIGMVKAFVRGQLLQHKLEDTDMIFAQGRDAGYPHSRGEDDMPLQHGQSIVFDLFPRELGGGYHHDMTRTWCIDFAPPRVQKAYNDVMEAFDISVETFTVNKPSHLLQEAVLDNFEGKGHPTGRSVPGTMSGYVHSLGHGLGLDVHERPSISHVRREDILQVGNCITIEPGLYYPDEGFGIRVEDTFVINENGELISLTPFRKDLVLPLKGKNKKSEG